MPSMPKKAKKGQEYKAQDYKAKKVKKGQDMPRKGQNKADSAIGHEASTQQKGQLFGGSPEGLSCYIHLLTQHMSLRKSKMK